MPRAPNNMLILLVIGCSMHVAARGIRCPPRLLEMTQCQALRDLRRSLIFAEYLGIAYRVSQVRMQSLLQPIHEDMDFRFWILDFGIWTFMQVSMWVHNVKETCINVRIPNSKRQAAWVRCRRGTVMWSHPL
jgi:hypothetical protein